MAMASATNDDDQKLSSLECAICFDKYKSGVKVPKMINCGHTFCDGCINSMIQYHQLECPTCRQASFAPQAGFPTNFAVLGLVDEEESRAKSFKYNCSDCSKGLTVDMAFVCKCRTTGVICLDCFLDNHNGKNHGGMYPLKMLLRYNRSKIKGSLKRLKENREKYDALDVDIRSRRASIDSLISDFSSTNDYITRVMDDLRTEIDEMDEIKRMFDEDDSRFIEILTISGQFETFQGDCNVGIARIDEDLAMTERKLDIFETGFKEMTEKLRELEENAADGSDSPTQAHKLRPYLELLKSKADGDGSGDQTQGREVVGAAASTTAASVRIRKLPSLDQNWVQQRGDGGEQQRNNRSERSPFQSSRGGGSGMRGRGGFGGDRERGFGGGRGGGFGGDRERGFGDGRRGRGGAFGDGRVDEEVDSVAIAKMMRGD